MPEIQLKLGGRISREREDATRGGGLVATATVKHRSLHLSLEAGAVCRAGSVGGLSYERGTPVREGSAGGRVGGGVTTNALAPGGVSVPLCGFRSVAVERGAWGGGTVVELEGYGGRLRLEMEEGMSGGGVLGVAQVSPLTPVVFLFLLASLELSDAPSLGALI